MNAKKCDRCGKFYILPSIEDKNTDGLYIIKATPSWRSMTDGQAYNGTCTYELCEECSASFDTFMKCFDVKQEEKK